MFHGLTMVNFDGQTQNQMMVRLWSAMVDHGRPCSDGQTVAGQLIRQRDFLQKKANKTGSNYLRQAFQQLTYKVTYMLRKLRSDHYSKQIEENSGDMKRTWKILK